MRKSSAGWKVGFLAFGLLAGAGGCGGTSRPMVAMARFGTVLVVGVSSDSELRRTYERAFELRFAERNVVALSSLVMMRPGQPIDRAAVVGVTESTGVDAVLITWMVDPQEPGGGAPPPPEPHKLYEHYTTIEETVHTPGYLQNAEVVQLQTRLYDARTGELVITLYSDVIKRGNAEEAIQSVSRALVARLVKADLF